MFQLDTRAIYDLILSLQKCEARSFPQQMINALSHYFPDSTIAFHPGSLYDLLTTRKGIVTQRPKYFLPMVFNQERLYDQKENKKLKEYSEYYYMTDIKQPPNLPSRLRGKTVLRFSDMMSEDEFKHSEMYYYLQSCNLLNNATVYLYDGNVCLGGVAFLRSQDKGDYSQDELTFMEFMGKYLSNLYVASLKETYYSGIAEIYKKNQDVDKTGIAVLTSKFDVIEANDTIVDYCDQILENAPELRGIPIRNSSKLSVVARTVAALTHEGGTELKHEISIQQTRYSCTLRPIIMHPLTMDIWSLYIFQISKTTLQDSVITDASIKQYDLTDRERDIAELIAKGFNTSQISKELFISPNTVKNHVSNLFRKLEVSNRIELINKLASSGTVLLR